MFLISLRCGNLRQKTAIVPWVISSKFSDSLSVIRRRWMLLCWTGGPSPRSSRAGTVGVLIYTVWPCILMRAGAELEGTCCCARRIDSSHSVQHELMRWCWKATNSVRRFGLPWDTNHSRNGVAGSFPFNDVLNGRTNSALFVEVCISLADPPSRRAKVDPDGFTQNMSWHIHPSRW
jgi:hypothetical protein